MITKRRTRIATALATLLSTPLPAFAQTSTAQSPHVPLQKTIGQSGPAGYDAAVVGGAALRTAAVGAYGPYGAACGYYPYPPCY